MLGLMLTLLHSLTTCKFANYGLESKCKVGIRRSPFDPCIGAKDLSSPSDTLQDRTRQGTRKTNTRQVDSRLNFKHDPSTVLVSSIGCTCSNTSSCTGLIFVMIHFGSYTESGVLLFREWKLVQIVAR